MEPGETDPIRLKQIRENRSNLSKWWGPWWRVSTSVCNFRLIGDEENSSIEFAEMSDEFSQTIIDTREKFFKKWMEAKEGFYTFARDNEESPTIQSYGPVDQILDTKPWHNHMNVQETKKGFKSPFMLDFGSLHRVLVGDQSTRVTFRLHSGMKLDWNTMKDYRQQGILLKC